MFQSPLARDLFAQIWPDRAAATRYKPVKFHVVCGRESWELYHGLRWELYAATTVEPTKEIRLTRPERKANDNDRSTTVRRRCGRSRILHVYLVVESEHRFEGDENLSSTGFVLIYRSRYNAINRTRVSVVRSARGVMVP